LFVRLLQRCLVLRVPVAQISRAKLAIFFRCMQFVIKNIGRTGSATDLVLGIMRRLGSHPSAAKRLIRRCPMCKEAMGIVIADSVKNVRRFTASA
jgi:hypothetical protein